MELAYFALGFVLLWQTSLSVYARRPRSSSAEEYAWPSFASLAELHSRIARQIVGCWVGLSILFVVGLFGMAYRWKPWMLWTDGRLAFAVAGLLPAVPMLLYLAGNLFIQFRWERAFGKRYPRFVHCVPSFGSRLVGVGVLVLVGAIVGLTAPLLPRSIEFLLRLAIVLLIAQIALLLARRLVIVWARSTRVRLPEDSSWHEVVRSAADASGVEVGRTYVLRSLVANAIAAPTGDVITTTALLELLEPEEVKAVLAHEFSHRIDKDAKKTTGVYFVLSIAVLVLLVVLVGHPAEAYRDASGIFWFPIVLWSGLPIAAWAARILYSIGSRAREFKSDRFAAERVSAESLATGLLKLHAFLNQPLEWSPLMAFTLTHPSVGRRVQAMGVDLDQALASAGLSRV
ncbi:MAG: M48 family metalloprotease [Fimbriimonadaceae bacterium]|nr:M48 family metalloprotease [Chthonomonadaceae bacterium]MCO5297065.1 M48 family metalloprotease [Fimbriimonadaceae bacterium]